MCGGIGKYVQKQWRYGNLPQDAIWCFNRAPNAQDAADTRMMSGSRASGSDAG